MEDSQILDLFFRRSEHSIDALHNKYYRFCYSVIMKIVPDSRDIEECINDTFLRTWNSIPPNRPECLSAYLATIARNVAIDRYSYNTARMRNSALTVAFEELEPFLPAFDSADNNIVNEQYFKEFMNRFLKKQSKEARVFFIRRYWYGDSIEEIATSLRCSTGRITGILFRTRQKLHKLLEKEDYFHE